MRSLKNKEHWESQIKSGQLQHIQGGPLIASFRDGLDGVDSDVLAEVSRRLIGLAIMEVEWRGGALAPEGASGPVDLRALLASLRGREREANSTREELVLEMVAELFALLRDPGHRWFEKAVENFGAVTRALLRKALRNQDKAGDKRRVTRWVRRKGRLVMLRPVVRRVVTADADELERRFDASAVAEDAADAAEREAADRIVERAQAVARDADDLRIVVLVLARFDAHEIARILDIRVRQVRYRIKMMGVRREAAQRGDAGPARVRPARRPKTTSAKGDGCPGEGGVGVPPLRAAE